MNRCARGIAVIVAMMMIPAARGVGQSPQCPGGTPAALVSQDACQQAVDLFHYLAPQLATAIAGGNAILGQGGTLGGLGHFSVGVRANAVVGSIPQVQEVPPRITGSTPGRSFPTNDSPIAMPAADASIGIFKGIPLALTNVAGVDLLLSATWVPKVDRDNVTITPDNPLHLGYGVRVGALQESLLTPGVSLTFLKRDLPVLEMVGQYAGATGPVSLRVSDATVETTAWRVVASKSFILFGLALGAGQDTYDSRASAQATTLGQTSSLVSLSQKMTRSSAFLDISVNLPLVKLVGEIGQASGGKEPAAAVNSFEGKGIVGSRLYGSFGVRFGW